MDLRLFEKMSADVAPILVRLYDHQKLYTLAEDGSPSARTELTTAVVELLEKNLNERERELISDVLISLMRQAQSDLRRALADRLAVLENAPLRVVLHMANDEIAVAEPMLKQSPVLSDLDLAYIIKGKGSDYWRAIAGRAPLSQDVMDLLADTREPGTVRALAENGQIHLSRHAADVIGDMAQISEDLARPLLMRPDVPESVARRLYRFVGDDLRNYIRDYFGVQDAEVLGAVDDVIFELANEKADLNFMPTAKTMQAVDAMVNTGRLTHAVLMDTLQRGQYATFIAMFSRYAGMGPRAVHDMLSEGDGKVLAIVCRAIDLSKGDLSRIYMMTQRLRSQDRIVDHKELLRCLAMYDSVTMAKARSLLGAEDKK